MTFPPYHLSWLVREVFGVLMSQCHRVGTKLMTIPILIRRSTSGIMAAGLLWLVSTAASATTVLFENFDPEAPFAPTFGLNIWSVCTGRAIPFTVTEAGYVA